MNTTFKQVHINLGVGELALLDASQLRRHRNINLLYRDLGFGFNCFWRCEVAHSKVILNHSFVK